MAQVATMTLDQCAQHKSGSVYILNLTKPAGQVMMEVHDGLGGKDVMVLAPTWIPIDVTMFSTKEAILKSPKFREYVMAGLLAIIDPKEAEAILKRPDAASEQERVYKTASKVSHVDIGPNNTSGIPEDLSALADDELHPMVLNLLEEPDGVDDGHALSMVRGRVGDLNLRDLQALANRCTYPSVKSFAAEAVLSHKG